ncbi:hypothetical protein Y695_00676 [Hydrogenophaga sp. T4]|nr:hypothetical protein Y695_00676 [Hydrogenophaga sp. T4]
MGGVDHDLQALEGEVVGEGALAELDVATRRVVHATRLAQVARVGPDRVLVQLGLDGVLPVVRELVALRAEELDAVVSKRVVACRDHHAQAGALCACQVGHGRCRHRSEQDHVHPGGVEAGLQRAFQHVARDARVLADEHRGVRLVALEHAPHGVGQFENKIGRDRGLADGSADAVGAKVFTGHGFDFRVPHGTVRFKLHRP